MQQVRPMFLNLMQIRFPVTAIISIGHRLSGVVLFLALPWLLYLYQHSIASLQSFNAIRQGLHSMPQIIFAVIVLAAALYHLVAGLRHLIMDIGIGESWAVARVSAYLTFIVWIVLLAVCGVWIW